MIRERTQPTVYGQPCRSIAIGSDHGGFALKQQLVEHLKAKHPNISVTDVGCFNEQRVDYPDIAAAASKLVQDKMVDRAIILDGVGVASSIVANKHNGIRAAVVHDHFSASMSRLHSDCNVFCLGGQVLGPLLAKEIVDIFIKTQFEGDRHIPRLEKVEAIETSQSAAVGSVMLRRSVGAGGGAANGSASPYKLPL